MNTRVVTALIVSVAATGAVAFVQLARAEEAPRPAPSPFAAWNGKWQGTFFVYRPDGTVLTELDVTQHYREESPTRQVAEFHETDQDGNVTTATAVNAVEDGKLWCRVSKSNGERSEHRGRVLDGGGLCWYAVTEDKTESFFERVRHTDDGTFYEIHGYGIYGASSFYFEGSYEKVE